MTPGFYVAEFRITPRVPGQVIGNLMIDLANWLLKRIHLNGSQIRTEELPSQLQQCRRSFRLLPQGADDYSLTLHRRYGSNR